MTVLQVQARAGSEDARLKKSQVLSLNEGSGKVSAKEGIAGGRRDEARSESCRFGIEADRRCTTNTTRKCVSLKKLKTQVLN